MVRKKYCNDYITLVSLGTGTCAPFDPRDHQSTGLIQWARLFPEITIQALSNHVNNKLSMLDMSSDSAVHDPLFRFIRIQVNNLALDEVVTDSTDSHFLHSLGQRALRTIDTPSESNYARYREVLGLLTDITRENADISNEQFDLSDFSHIEDE